jgi:hypothetical protein
VLAMIALGLGVVAVSEHNRSRGSTLPVLEFLQFGDPAESSYCLPP